MIKFALLTDTAKAPTRKHETDAGIDLYADFGDGMALAMRPNECSIVHTGVTVEIPKGFFGWITNKSGSDYLIGGGIVDEGYQGELLVKVINVTNHMLFFTKDSKAIAQLLIIPCLVAPVSIVQKKSIHVVESDRGSSGGIVIQNGADPLIDIAKSRTESS